MATQQARNGLWMFMLIWFGQLVSQIGSGLTWFALGVWVLQQTGSVTQFALISFFIMLPGILVAPLAGVVVDRLDRRWVMILSDSCALLGTLSMAGLLAIGRFEVWHVYLVVALGSICSAFQWPAYSALTPHIVPKQHLGRASGMVQLSEAAGQLISPILAGALLVLIGLQGILLIDVATFFCALSTLLLVRTPKLAPAPEEQSKKQGFRDEAAYGWRYIRARRGLLALLLFFAATNFTSGVVQVLLTPLILSFASPTTLGVVLTVAGCGMLLGSVAMSVWGGPRRRIYGILGFSLCQGLLLLMGGLQPATLLVAAVSFVYLFCMPIIVGCSQAIWQVKVAPHVQGRVFAIRFMIARSTLPLAYLLAGPLADLIFEPLLAADGPLASSVGQLIGVGPGRGVGLLFMLMGALTVLATLVGYLYPRLRKVEQELPDAQEDELAEPVDHEEALSPALRATPLPLRGEG